MRSEEACLILRNTAEIVRKHYLKLEDEGTKIEAATRREQAYDACAATVQQNIQ